MKISGEIKYYYKHYLLKNILTSVSFICWLFKRYIYMPIEAEVENSAIHYRLRNFGNIDRQIYRFRRMKVYQIYKKQNEKYRNNMEVIAKASEKTGIPQYKLLENVNVDTAILFYKKPYLELLKYSFPSWKQTISAIHDLLIYFKQRWQYYVWNRVEEFFVYHWVYRTLLYRIRGKEEGRAWTICYRWEFQKYLYREKRLRREKQIAYYKKLKASLP